MTNHIMLSYQRNSTNLVSKIFDYLEKNQSTPLWMDQHGGVKEYLSESLAEGVENCCVIVCFLTPEYQDSEYCKKEIRYASELHKPIIPILVGSNDKTIHWKPSQWLGFTITDLLYLNFTNIDENNFENKGHELLEKINSILHIKQSQIPQESHLVEEQSDEEEFEINSPLILPSSIHQGPQINDRTISIIPKKYSSEGDSSVRLINQSTDIQSNQDLYSKNGFFINSFILSRFIFHNTSSQSISIIQLTAEYEDKTKRWISCQIKTNLNEDFIHIDSNKLLLCSLTIEIRLEGEPGIDNQHRFRAHHLLPQPLKIRISIEDTQMKHSNLIIEQVNQPLNLPTLEKFLTRLNISQSNFLGFVWCDDCSIDIRYFLVIFSLDDEDILIKFCFGCDLSSFRCPSWNKQFIQSLQKTARKRNANELFVHENVMDPFFNCKALFDQQFKLQAIQIQIRTNTSFTEQTIPLPIKQIFTETLLL